MRVMHQVNSLVMGGSNTFLYRLAKYRNEDLVVYSHKDGIIRQWLEDLNIPVYLKDDKNISYLIDYLKIDVLVMHTGSTLPDYVKELKVNFPNLKFITVLHTMWVGDEWVDKIVCVSNKLYSINNPDKAVLIYPGIDRRKRFVVGEVCRLGPYKYLEDVIKVAKLVSDKNPDIMFRIIGDDAEDSQGYKDMLKAKIKEEKLIPYFEFIDYLENIDYSQFDAFIHLVGNEVYPVTILEALNRNLPTFSYPRIGTLEMKHPLLFLSNSLEDIAQGILGCIEIKPKHMKECANQFTKLYKEVIK
jgi:glycosyltransferase involved in cell wall biosynthesis